MTPGQAAYEEWRKTVSAVAVGNADELGHVAAFLDALTPEWDTVSEHVKAAWQRIAQAAIACPVSGMARVPTLEDGLKGINYVD